MDRGRNLTFEDRMIFATGKRSSVNILTYGENSTLKKFSGFIIDKVHGIICVNRHTVEDNQREKGVRSHNIKIQFNEIQEEIDAETVYISDKYNIALIKFQPKDLRENLKIISDVIFSIEPLSKGIECFNFGDSLGAGSQEGSRNEVWYSHKTRPQEAIHNQSGSIGVITDIATCPYSGKTNPYGLSDNIYIEERALLYDGTAGGQILNSEGLIIGMGAMGTYRLRDEKLERGTHDESVFSYYANLKFHKLYTRKRADGTIITRTELDEPEGYFIPSNQIIEVLEEVIRSGDLVLTFKTDIELKKLSEGFEVEGLVRNELFKSPEQLDYEDNQAISRQEKAKNIYETQIRNGLTPAKFNPNARFKNGEVIEVPFRKGDSIYRTS